MKASKWAFFLEHSSWAKLETAVLGLNARGAGEVWAHNADPMVGCPPHAHTLSHLYMSSRMSYPLRMYS